MIHFFQNLAKAIQIVTRAVEEDEKQNYKDAYYLYCEGLQYFVPLIAAETDTNKRTQLQLRAITYMERAEEIKRSAKQMFFQRQCSQNSATPSNQTSRDEPNTSAENAVKQAIIPTSGYKHLRKKKQFCLSYFLIPL